MAYNLFPIVTTFRREGVALSGDITYSNLATTRRMACSS